MDGRLMIDLLLGSLWLSLGLAAIIWLALIGGLMRSPLALVLPRGRRLGRLSVSDRRLLRSMHIRL